MELYRNGLKLTATIGLDESRGSVNVPVRLLHNENDEYLNYTEQIHIRYLFDNQVKEEILPTNDNGFYIPGKPLSHNGPIELAVHLINGNVELVTNELSFIVNNAPNGTTQVDPSEFTWQQLVDQYVNAKLDTFADKADMNKFKDDVNANLSNQDKKITDLQNTTKVSLDSQNTKIDNFKSEVNTSLSNQNTSINQTTSTQNSKIATLESRMNTFTSLSEGSTTGDAELKDIRVGANGITYNNAGDAVRGQYSQLKEDLDNIETNIINVLGYGNISTGGGDVSPINIDFSCRTFVKIKNKSTNQAYITPNIYQNGVLKQGYLELYNAGEEKITSITNVNSDGIHWGWIEIGKDITSYEWTVGIQNTNNVEFEYEIFQLKSDSPIRNNNTIIVDVNNDYGCFKYISDAIGYAKLKFDVNTVPITIYIKNGKYNLTYVPIDTNNGRYAALNKGANMISLIGESREGVIIELMNTPARNNKMVEHGGPSTIANITWRNLWINDGSTGDYRSNAYCIHNDNIYSESDYYETVVENCNLYSEAFAPIGAGLHNRQKQIYRNCNIVFNSLDTSENGYNKWAPIYVHSPGIHTARDCSLEIDMCTCNAQKGTEALSLPNVSGSLQYTDIPVSIRRSIFVTNGSVVTYVNKDNTLLKSDSALNNISDLNY